MGINSDVHKGPHRTAERLRYILHLTRAKMRQDVRTYSLGLIWWYLDPVINTMILYIIVVVVLGWRTEDMAVFLLTGLLMFRFLQGTISQSCGSLNAAMTLSSRMYVPKISFVLRDVFAEILKFVIGLVFLVAVALVIGERDISAFEMLSVLAVATLFVLGASLLVAFASILVRDVRVIIGYVFRALFFLSGTFFSLDRVAPEWRTTFLLNPFALLMHEMRLALGSPKGLDWGMLAGLTVVSLLMVAAGSTLLIHFDRKLPKYVI